MWPSIYRCWYIYLAVAIYVQEHVHLFIASINRQPGITGTPQTRFSKSTQNHSNTEPQSVSSQEQGGLGLGAPPVLLGLGFPRLAIYREC